MKTAVTLDDDTAMLIRRRMRERNVSFDEALNDAIRDGVRRLSESSQFDTTVADLETLTANLDRALRLSGERGDEQALRPRHDGAAGPSTTSW